MKHTRRTACNVISKMDERSSIQLAGEGYWIASDTSEMAARVLWIFSCTSPCGRWSVSQMLWSKSPYTEATQSPSLHFGSNASLSTTCLVMDELFVQPECEPRSLLVQTGLSHTGMPSRASKCTSGSIAVCSMRLPDFAVPFDAGKPRIVEPENQLFCF